MKNLRLLILVIARFIFFIFISSCTGNRLEKKGIQENKTGDFYIGWSFVDITPDKPVLVAGQFPARISEGILDPVTATILAIESGKHGGRSDSSGPHCSAYK